MAWCWIGDEPLTELMLSRFTAYTTLRGDELRIGIIVDINYKTRLRNIQ